MFLAIDAGNTHTTFGIFENDKIKTDFRISTKALHDQEVFTDFLQCTLQSLQLDSGLINHVGISSVVPSVDKNLETVIKNIFRVEPFFVSPNCKLPFKLLVEHPEEVGADRICNVVAAYKKYGGPTVIVDFGTATVYDIISKDGDFIGGVIAPGIQTSAKALSMAAEKLPEIELKFPNTVIGKNTVANMQSGILYGAVDAFEGMINRIKKELDDVPTVIITGGFSKLISSKTSIKIFIEFDLVLEGIKLLTDYNS